MTIDTHAHVFTDDCALAASRRYAPSYQAPLDDYLAVLDRFGVEHAVLVQPSFLGTDNSYLLECLRRHPDRLRGIAVTAPDTGDQELSDMAGAGVAGIRLNMIGAPLDLGPESDVLDLVERVGRLGMQVEIQAEGAVLAQALDRLSVLDVDLVVDHMGRPSAVTPEDCPGFQALCALAAHTRLWVKLSGPYRFAADATVTASALRRRFPADRLLWGSDWPWTQHETGRTYQECLSQRQAWLDPKSADAAARALFGFG